MREEVGTVALAVLAFSSWVLAFTVWTPRESSPAPVLVSPVKASRSPQCYVVGASNGRGAVLLENLSCVYRDGHVTNAVLK